MALSFDVTPPRCAAPEWPDCCVHCLADDSSRVIPMKTRSLGWWTFLFLSGSRFKAEAPCCERCCGKLKRQRWLRSAVFITAAVLVGYFGAELVNDVPSALQKWAVMGIGLVALSPFLVWDVLFPLPVDITAYTERVEYSFKSREYAQRFAALNGSLVG